MARARQQLTAAAQSVIWLEFGGIDMYYSAENNGFYPTKIYIPCPTDLVEITVEYHQELLDLQTNGMVIVANGKGYPVVIARMPPTDDERRATMVISKVKAMQNLKKAGKLDAVLDLMNTLPRDNDERILWDYSENLRRTDETLVKVCKEQLGLDDLGIDNLFM